MREIVCTVMFLRYREREMLCTVMCVCEVQGEGNVYNDVCLRYMVREMCTVMCV